MEIIGYMLEYYKGVKFIGKIRTNEKDREHVGYRGKITQTATKDIYFKNKKIKKGEEFFTMLYPLNGR